MFHVTPGQAHDLDGVDILLPQINPDALIADRAYDTDVRMRDKLAKKGCQAVILQMPQRKKIIDYDKYLYRSRHLTENFFAKVKQYRAIATRYDKTAQNFLGAIYRATTIVWVT